MPCVPRNSTCVNCGAMVIPFFPCMAVGMRKLWFVVTHSTNWLVESKATIPWEKERPVVFSLHHMGFQFFARMRNPIGLIYYFFMFGFCQRKPVGKVCCSMCWFPTRVEGINTFLLNGIHEFLLSLWVELSYHSTLVVPSTGNCSKAGKMYKVLSCLCWRYPSLLLLWVPFFRFP